VAVLPIMIEQSREQRLKPVPLAESPSFRMSRRRQSGFSLIELLIVIAIAMILMAMASPLVRNVISTYRLRTAGSDYANLMQTARMRAVQDDQYYPVWINAGAPPLAPNSNACVDFNANSACDWGVAGAVAEPAVAFHPAVQIQPFQAPAAPNLINLRGQYLPNTCGANGACVDVNPNAWGPTFGPRGLPCWAPAAANATCTFLSGTAGINGSPAGLPTAFETYVQNIQTGAWEAVTVSPAGRVRVWSYNTTTLTWAALN
jgi:prepilin-type N-terminal cleavage/methylation domain-containing protein